MLQYPAMLETSRARPVRLPAQRSGAASERSRGSSGRTSSGPLVAAQARRRVLERLIRQREAVLVRINCLRRRYVALVARFERATRAAVISGPITTPRTSGGLAPVKIPTAAPCSLRSTERLAVWGGVHRTHRKVAPKRSMRPFVGSDGFPLAVFLERDLIQHSQQTLWKKRGPRTWRNLDKIVPLVAL